MEGRELRVLLDRVSSPADWRTVHVLFAVAVPKARYQAVLLGFYVPRHLFELLNVVAADGKSRTVTVSGTDSKGTKFTSTAVYDKQ
jgi:hypothetical protein